MPPNIPKPGQEEHPPRFDENLQQTHLADSDEEMDMIDSDDEIVIPDSDDEGQINDRKRALNHLNNQSEDGQLQKNSTPKRRKPAVENPIYLRHEPRNSDASDHSPIAGPSNLAHKIPDIKPADEPHDSTEYEDSTCHQCRLKTKQPKMICDQSKDPRCMIRVCKTCLITRDCYNGVPELRAPIFDFVPGGKMLCVKCRNLCPCASCRRRRGEKEPSRRGSGTSTKASYGPTPKKQPQTSLKKKRKYPEGSDGSDYVPELFDDSITSPLSRLNPSRASRHKAGTNVRNGIGLDDKLEEIILEHEALSPYKSNPLPDAGPSRSLHKSSRNLSTPEFDGLEEHGYPACHQCGKTTRQPKMICDQSKDPRCIIQVCKTCLMTTDFYDKVPELRSPIFNFVPGGKMLCVKCRELCPCESCRMRRDEEDQSPQGTGSSVNSSKGLITEKGEESLLKPKEGNELKENNEFSSSIQKTLGSRTDSYVTLNDFERWQDDFEKDQTAKLAETLLKKQSISSVLLDTKPISADQQIFSHSLTEESTPVIDQKSSGRCWLFATFNTVCMGIIKKFDLDEFELSQSYYLFYEKLERCNYYLENMIELVEEPIDARIISHLSSNPLGDVDQWDMVVGLIVKYGLVPKSIFDKSRTSSNLGVINDLLTSELHAYALKIRQIYSDTKTNAIDNLRQDSGSAVNVGLEAARKAKKAMMDQVYRSLAIALGSPPSPVETFHWDYSDKLDKAYTISCTPLDFYYEHCAEFQLSEYISLINDPRNPYNTTYTVDRLGTVWGGSRTIRHLNTSTNVLKSLVINMIKADRPVWFGCDAGKMLNPRCGILDTDLGDYEAVFGVRSRLSKSDRLHIVHSPMAHVMVITAVHLDQQGKPVRYKVKSWTNTDGDHDCFVMTDAWFDEYVYQIVLPKDSTPDRLRQVYNESVACVFPPWDPMARLA